ncbi:MAG: VOC family protein [Candidatus Thermoplasmatota archaeon]|jgi:catechol 2,3-dioxygenase-like lactoylglutathione lyase family enzyme|nr:VOC family protein [Candidatus Thermoplasmatota archaeon]
MEARVYQITLVVRDQESAVRYYTEKVGFEIKTDFTPPGGERWVTVGPKGQDIEMALYPAGRGDPNGWSAQWKPGTLPPLVLRVNDCRAVFSELKARGVEFKQEEPEEHPWGISCTFSDPDGNLFSLNQLPESPAWK